MMEHMVQKAHDQKLAKYADRCAQEGLAFLSMAEDTFRSWHTEALGLITPFGTSWHARSGTRTRSRCNTCTKRRAPP